MSLNSSSPESLDRETKAALYARAGIPEYWIVNLTETTVEVHRHPDLATGTYRTKAVVSSQGTLAATGVTGLTVAVAELFR